VLLARRRPVVAVAGEHSPEGDEGVQRPQPRLGTVLAGPLPGKLVEDPEYLRRLDEVDAFLAATPPRKARHRQDANG